MIVLRRSYQQVRWQFSVIEFCHRTCSLVYAETDVLYTTLDILLATSVDGKENMNMIYNELGDDIMNVLLDTFVWDGTALAVTFSSEA